jgi:hypothetical protein
MKFQTEWKESQKRRAIGAWKIPPKIFARLKMKWRMAKVASRALVFQYDLGRDFLPLSPVIARRP